MSDVFDKNPKLKDVACRLLKFGLYQTTVCDWLNISTKTLERARKLHPEIDDAITLGTPEGRAMGLAKLIEKVEAGDMQAIKYFLTNICGLATKVDIEHSGDVRMVFSNDYEGVS